MTSDRLTRALNRSRDRAPELTRSFFDGPPWDADRVARFVNSVGAISIATVGPTGHPHAAFTIAGCIDHRIVFTVTGFTILRRNLEHEHRVGFSVASVEDSIMGQGTASELGADDDAWAIAPDGWTGSMWEIDPAGIVAP